MNEQHFAYRVRHHLNQGLDLDAQVLARLKAAREQALSSQLQAKAGLVAQLAGASGGGDFSAPGRAFSRILLPLVVMASGMIAVTMWHQQQQAAEIEEIDAAVLTGDLPIDAYLDKGFDAWLKRSQQ
jgi:hypothetical protein